MLGKMHLAISSTCHGELVTLTTVLHPQTNRRPLQLVIVCSVPFNMTETSYRQSSRLRYSQLSSEYFDSLRVDRSLAHLEKRSLSIDCQLHRSHRCKVNKADIDVLDFRLTTSQSGDTSLLAATVDLTFQQIATERKDSELTVTFCHPTAIKGVPQVKHKTGQQTLEPQVSVGDAVQVSLGNISKGAEWDSTSSWMFQCLSQSRDAAEGHYNSLRLQLQARNRQSASSYCQRPLVAAASLDNADCSITITSQVRLRTSMWQPFDRVWRPSLGSTKPQQRVVKIASSVPATGLKAFDTLEELEEVIRLHVERGNEQNVPSRKWNCRVAVVSS
jgi:hypothetical protein